MTRPKLLCGIACVATRSCIHTVNTLLQIDPVRRTVTNVEISCTGCARVQHPIRSVTRQIQGLSLESMEHLLQHPRTHTSPCTALVWKSIRHAYHHAFSSAPLSQKN